VAANGLQVSPATICRALQRLKLPGKKALHATERDTARVQTLRATFLATVKPLDVRRPKFVDEAGATLIMTRRYGRATPGQRVVDNAPVNYGENYTILATISLDGLHALCRRWRREWGHLSLSGPGRVVSDLAAGGHCALG
jgi:hypothetical protein